MNDTIHDLRRANWSSIDRRRFIACLGAGVGGAIVTGVAGTARAVGDDAAGESSERRWLSDYPFTLGVASGDPTPDGAVLWTRLAPQPADPSALGDARISVRWRVAADDAMRHVVASGRARATADLAHSVHVEVEGLRPGCQYWYQFSAGGHDSPVGRFRTAPDRRAHPEALRLAIATCQDWPSGFYTPYQDMLTRDLDMVVHLGDYTYEYGIGESVRGPAPEGFEAETVDLATYRNRHALYKLDADLQAAHAAFPFVIVWDDHEVQNDYSGLAPEYAEPSPEFAARRAAAYQAFYEHTPIRASSLAKSWEELRIYRRLRWGRLAELTMLDDRQYRTDNPCGDGESLRCDDAFNTDVTMLGERQERWVRRGFERSQATWNLVGQQLLLAELEHLPYEDERYWNDAWDGYPGARQRLLQTAVDTGLANPVFFTGDWHSTFVNDLKLDFKDPAAATVATEFVTPAITTGGDGTPYGPYYGPMVPFNPHIRYFEGDRRGYLAVTVTEQAMEVDLRFVSTVESPAAEAYTERMFTVEAGRAGAIV